MLIISLVLAVIGLAALVFAVITSNELVAWVCIGASVLGVVLLIIDALQERKRREAGSGGRDDRTTARSHDSHDSHDEDDAADYPGTRSRKPTPLRRIQIPRMPPTTASATTTTPVKTCRPSASPAARGPRRR